MTTVTQEDVLGVSDAAGRDLGAVVVESIEGDLVLGDFSPGPDYPAVEPTFRAFADMVEQNSFHFIDEATADIARIGVNIRANTSSPPLSVWDVQIYPDGGFSCRLPPAAERNGTHH